MTTACCPGSFDPVTNGHLDVIVRASRGFDQIIVAVAENLGKNALFTVEERIDMLTEVTSHLDTVKVDSFSGLTTDFCKSVGAAVIVKGLRAVTDFDYEMQMAQMNRRMGVETAFLAANPEYTYLSSSLMKEVVKFGGPIDGLVPDVVLARMKEKFGGP